jgi:hypothetical protein
VAAILETLTTFTPLGLRFWDPATDQQVRDALRVEASPSARPGARVAAVRSFGDVYSFPHLPGLRDVEYGFAPAAVASPPQARAFVVQVADARARYLPIALQVALPLPYRGVYLCGVAGSPAEATPRGLHLYSAPGRPLPASAAAVRGELRRADDGTPAAHALVRVETESAESWYGLSDGHGRFVVILPYPPLAHGFGGSPASPGHRPLSEQVWQLSLSVFYQPDAQTVLPGSAEPDYLSVLQQAQADLYEHVPADGGVPVASLPVALLFDRHPTVRTDGVSQLLVMPSTASP